MSPSAVEIPNGSSQVAKPEMPKKPVYYIEGIGDRLKPEMRRLFETYSGIPSEKVETHLYAARKAAWQLHPYPCLGMWSFLNPSIRHLNSYASLLSSAKTPNTRILDIGCGLGQDLRQLVFDGVPVENLWACDSEAGLWGLGMGLFMDEERLAGGGERGVKGVDFMRGNVLNLDEKEAKDSSRCLSDWKGTFDLIYAGNVLHLFSGDDVVRAAKNMLSLTKPGGKIILYQIGGQGVRPPHRSNNAANNNNNNNNYSTNSNSNSNKAKDERAAAGMQGFPGYAHNGTSWRELWEVVEGETGIKAELETWSRDFQEWDVPVEDVGWLAPGSCAFEVFVRRCD